MRNRFATFSCTQNLPPEKAVASIYFTTELVFLGSLNTHTLNSKPWCLAQNTHQSNYTFSSSIWLQWSNFLQFAARTARMSPSCTDASIHLNCFETQKLQTSLYNELYFQQKNMFKLVTSRTFSFLCLFLHKHRLPMPLIQGTVWQMAETSVHYIKVRKS